MFLRDPAMHCAKQVRLTDSGRGRYKMSAGRFKQFEPLSLNSTVPILIGPRRALHT